MCQQNLNIPITPCSLLEDWIHIMKISLRDGEEIGVLNSYNHQRKKTFSIALKIIVSIRSDFKRLEREARKDTIYTGRTCHHHISTSHLFLEAVVI